LSRTNASADAAFDHAGWVPGRTSVVVPVRGSNAATTPFRSKAI
jgi:hypothetical protein